MNEDIISKISKMNQIGENLEIDFEKILGYPNSSLEFLDMFLFRSNNNNLGIRIYI